MRTLALLMVGWIAATLPETGVAEDHSSLPNAEPGTQLSVDLGGLWECRMDPSDVGRNERWFEDSVPYPRTIRVPGAWNAQGVAFESGTDLSAYEARLLEEQKQLFGLGTLGKESESAKLFSAYPGPMWYRRTITVPASWHGRVPWLVFHGIHREGEVWLNGKFAGAHHSYLTPFRIDLSPIVRAGDSIHVAVRVDARRNRAVDPLMGCFDTLDFLYVSWGGLFRTVTLEATAATRIRDVFVVPHLHSKSAEIRLALEGALMDSLAVEAEVFDAGRRSVGRISGTVARGTNEGVLHVSIPSPKLWSPQSPHLYTAEVHLLSAAKLLETRSVRFGMREFHVTDGKFFLNGQPIFLRGYGDDCIFPNTLCPPADKTELSRRLAAARDYGFNYVRHHSWTPPEEYLDAADELGMMLQPEFPFAYRWDLPTTLEAKRSALEQWEAVIRSARNHPSVVVWCMGNELYDSFDLAPAMYQAAKRLDPTRPVIDSDGSAFQHQDRETLDFMVVQFNEGNSIGLQDSKYHVPETVRKPVIAHEMGYFVTLPKLDQIPFFQGGLRPYWLLQARDLALQRGVFESYETWLQASHQLQAACLKSNLEAARRSRLSGTSVWLFQDYPNCAEGVVDMFFRPKGLTAAEFRAFNAPTVLLLDLPDRNWREQTTTELRFLISRFEDPPSVATLRWSLRAGDRTVASGKQESIQVASGGVQTLPGIPLVLPTLPDATQLTLSAQLEDETGTTRNAWDVWIFPEARVENVLERVQVENFDVMRLLYPGIQEWDSRRSEKAEVLVTTRLGQEERAYLNEGGRVFLVNPDGPFAVEKTNYRLSSWDGGGPSGTWLDTTHPALQRMPSKGWCDLQFYRLIQNSTPAFLDGLPIEVKPVVRCIDRPTRLSNRAYLFEVRVGRGRLLVSGFNFSDALRSSDAGAIFFFNHLLRYTLGSEFSPQASLSASALTPRSKP